MNGVMWHHGTCDACQVRHILVSHFNYFNQENCSFRFCEGCWNKGIGHKVTQFLLDQLAEKCNDTELKLMDLQIQREVFRRIDYKPNKIITKEKHHYNKNPNCSRWNKSGSGK